MARPTKGVAKLNSQAQLRLALVIFSDLILLILYSQQYYMCRSSLIQLGSYFNMLYILYLRLTEESS